MEFKNLIMIGTSHIAQESLNEVKSMIENHNPEIIALELDKGRFFALTQKVKSSPKLKNVFRIGLKGFLFSLIGSWVEKKLGSIVGVAPGSEMLTAIDLAKKNNIKIALIDQNIEITLKRISKTFSWREKFNFIADIFNGIFFKKRQLKKFGFKDFDLSKVPSESLIKKLIKNVKLRYPNLYLVLIHERNVFMANNLIRLMHKFPEKKIIAIVGAGHIDGMSRLIKE